MANRLEEETINTSETGAQFDNDSMLIPIIEEEITIDKQIVATGKVNVSKRIREYEEVVDVPSYRGEVIVNRVPVNLFVDEQPITRQEGDTMIIPIVQEQMVMVKKLLLVEELHIQNKVVETHHPQTVTLLKDEVEVIRSTQNEHLDDLTKGFQSDRTDNSI